MHRTSDLLTNRIIASRIRSARIGRGVSVPDFAVALGCTNNELLAYESGGRLVPAVTLLNAARVTGFAHDWFFRANPDAAAARRPAAEMAVFA